MSTPVWSTDDYDQMAVLGRGSFGLVVKARHYDTGKRLAIKTLTETTQHGHDELLREAELLLACRGHRAVVQLRAMSVSPDPLKLSAVVMEYVGPILRHVLSKLRRGRPFQESQARSVMRQLLSGAAHMHRKGVIHRDIKPENVLVCLDSVSVKICDLGLAMSLRDSSPPYGRYGTAGYVAPEVLMGKADYDHKVDSWSLGCVMAELLTGRRLFRAGVADDSDQMLRNFPPPGIPIANRLRRVLPEDRLSGQGLHLLSGLLFCMYPHFKRNIRKMLL